MQLYFKLSEIPEDWFVIHITIAQELLDSVKERGVVQPITLKFENNKWTLVNGLRRLVAARRANIEYVPVRIHFSERTIPAFHI